MIRITGNRLSTRTIGISLLSTTLITTGLVGCASQPIKTSQTPLYQSVLQANQNLVGRQSYAFDYRANIVSPTLQTNNDARVSPHLQKLTGELIGQQQLNKSQQDLINEGLKYQNTQSDTISNSFNLIMKRFETSATGVVDLERGQIAISSEMRYKQHNAGAFIKVPVAADFGRSKLYADLSFLSEFATDPQYDGRYVEYDYSHLIKDKTIGAKPWYDLVQQFAILMPTLAKESEYQRLALTSEDRQKGITQRIGYQTSYNQIVAEYLLYFYVNQPYLKSLMDNVDLTAAENLKNGGVKAGPRYLMGKIFESKTLTTVDEQAYESAMHLYYAISEMRDQEEGYTTDSTESNDGNAETEVTVTEVDTENASSDNDTFNDNESSTESVAKALTAFDKYQADKLVTANDLAKIIADNPQAFTALQTAISEESEDIFKLDEPLHINYGLNARNQMINATSAMNINFNDKLKTASAGNTQIQTVLNFYDYGKAKVDSSIFNNSVSWQQATQQNNLLSISKQARAFDSDKNLEALAYSLLQQQKSYADTYATLYSYNYLMAQDEDELASVDMQALQTIAKSLGMIAAKGEHLTDEQIPDSPYFDEDVKYTIDKIMKETDSNQQYFIKVQRLKAQGKTDAQIFSQLYTEMVEDETNSASETGADQAAEAAAAVAAAVPTGEQYACSTLLDTEMLDKKSLNSLRKICDKIDKASQAAYREEQAQTFEAEVMPSAAEVAAQKRREQQFNQLLGEIASEDMQKQAKQQSLDEDDDTLIERLKPHFEVSMNFDSDAYKHAYQILLLSKRQ